MKKTNAMRLLDKLSIPYATQEYDTKDGGIDGLSVAHKTGQDPETVFKTLVLKGASGQLYVFCLPVAEELPLKPAAAAAGEKSLAMLPLSDLLAATGYQRGGCSPIGMKKQYPTFLAESALRHPDILVSGGRIGLQLKLSPKNLVDVTQASLFSL